MSRRKKLHASPPPLSFIDKLIYFLLVLMALGFGIFCFYMLAIYLPKQFAMQQGEFLAYFNPISLFCTFPFVLISIAMLTLFVTDKYEKKQPIFGNPSYKCNKPTLKVYPLFSKEWKNRPKLEKWERSRRNTIIIVCIVTAVLLLCVSLLGIANREIINTEYEIEKYNSFNRMIDLQKITDAKELCIFVDKGTSKSGTHYSISFEFIYDSGEEYEFKLGAIKAESYEEKLSAMLKIKAMFPESKITINNKYLEKAIKNNGYNEKETELIYELFSDK